MKWIYGIKEKFKTAMALAIVLLLVLITNMINKNHFAELQESFTSVYEDRLLVENYIYKLSQELNAKRITVYSTHPNNQERNLANKRIDQLVKDFQNTKLTDEEGIVLAKFVVGVKNLNNMEDEYEKNSGVQVDSARSVIHNQFERLNVYLSKLSDIQLEEGQKLMLTSNNIVSTNHWYSRLEIVILIVIGLIIQALIFASKSLKPKLPQNEQLN